MLIDGLPEQVAHGPPRPRLEEDHLGWVPQVNVSIKISALEARPDPIDFAGALDRLLAVMRAADFGEALDLANASDYRLTGGVFSRKASHLELARREFR